jgi:hypothetical protein
MALKGAMRYAKGFNGFSSCCPNYISSNNLRITFDNLTKFSIEDSANSIDEIRHRLQNYIELAIEVRKEVNKACLEIT